MWLIDYGVDQKEITSIEQIPEDVIGFVYLIEFTDGTKYIGKKNVRYTKKLKALKSGKPRAKACGIVYKNTGKGFRQKYDIIYEETDWKTYQGSHKECKNKTISKKYILDFAKTPLELTYLEAKQQMIHNVLKGDSFINDNILNKFYRNNLYPKSEE